MSLIILVHSAIDDASIGEQLGAADYSYHFVLQAFMPMLQQFGEVLRIADPESEVDALVTKHRARGEQCLLLSFAPPQKTPTGLTCPVVPVFAWEYSSIPDEVFAENWKNDWSRLLRESGAAITHSKFAQQVVCEKLGQDFPVVSVPAPLWETMQSTEPTEMSAPVKDLELRLSAPVVDTRSFEVTPDRIVPDAAEASALGNRYGLLWQGQALEYRFDDSCDEPLLFGFYGREAWGSWSQSELPWLMLPEAVNGPLDLELELTAYGRNIGRELTVYLGEESAVFTPEKRTQRYRFEMQLNTPHNLLSFRGLDSRPPDAAGDPRTMALGLVALRISRRGEAAEAGTGGESTSAAATVRAVLRLQGVVYTAVFNPKDKRKNWGDIVTAFCMAFRGHHDVTLVLKMTHSQMSYYMEEVFNYLSKLAPFNCRIVVVHGFLPAAEYHQLIDASTFFVNASRGEGQCLPLMESMSRGVPCIAPRNTAMAEYVDESCAFPIHSTPEPSFWPQDPRQLLKTEWHRINWHTLHDAFHHSYRVATAEPERYAEMSAAARDSARRFCSQAELEPTLEEFLRTVVGDGGAQS